MPDDNETLREWFDTSELLPCSECGEQALVKAKGGASYCLQCGAVDVGGVPDEPPEPLS